jgi:outer membrane protein assembly factor BamB
VAAKRSLIRRLVPLFLLASVLALVGPAARADQPVVTLSPGFNHPRGKVTVSGSGFGATEHVTVLFDRSTVGRTTTDQNGTFSTDIKVPSSAPPGRSTIGAFGDSGLWATSVFVVNTDWLGFQFDAQNNRANLFENVLDPSNVSDVSARWTLSTGAPVCAAVAVSRGVAYVGTGWDLEALDAATGVLKWSFQANGPVDSGIAVAAGRVYFAANDFYSQDKFVYAVDTSGKELWTFSSKSEFTYPAVSGGIVYVTAGAHLHALDALTGTKLWSFRIGALGAFSAPAVANGVVYACGDFTLYAIDATTGAELWSTTGGGNSTPVVSNGTVYSGSHVGVADGQITASDVVTGAEMWTFTATDTGDMNSPAVADGLVYATAVGGSRIHHGWVFAVDAATGTQRWTAPLEDRVLSAPAIANGVVYAHSEVAIYALDAATGARLWRFVTPKGVQYSSPTIANGLLYAGTEGGDAYAFGLNESS